MHSTRRVKLRNAGPDESHCECCQENDASGVNVISPSPRYSGERVGVRGRTENAEVVSRPFLRPRLSGRTEFAPVFVNLGNGVGDGVCMRIAAVRSVLPEIQAWLSNIDASACHTWHSGLRLSILVHRFH